MKINKLIMTICILLISGSAFADVYVPYYERKDGTPVPQHYRSSPNDTKSDNWSTKGNRNPYNGREGTKNPQSGSGFGGSGGFR